MSDEELLGLRFRDLGVQIEGTWIERCIERLYRELDAKGIRFHPSCFLADEWLCPDGEPVIGIAFFLAHPRLKKLEQTMMLEVEGGDVQWCMRLLRHEAGHALNYAHFLHRRKRWRELFGPFSREYPDRYRYRPYSKSFVRHLDEWYAQCHPDEDFAETFAVWLDPRSKWRKVYKGWKALEKLEYVDHLMQKTGDGAPKKSEAERHWDVARLRSTLRTHYNKKREFYAEYYPEFHDEQLRQVFESTVEGDSIPAQTMLRRRHKAILDNVARAAGERKYIVNGLLKNLSSRCKELGLQARPGDADQVMRFAVYVTSLTMNYLYTGRFKKEKRQKKS
ncbi:MAG: putative zinc-binding metallopeptidase [Lentisphaerae bacterium]|nr:putative zinc-binding metallopeptidase [Lentisphaerota bacterium]